MGRRVMVLRGGERKRAVAAIVLAALLLPACGTTVEPYASAGLSKGERPRMAILPFENLSKAPGAAKTLEGMVLVELLKRAPISIVDPGEVSAALSKERVRVATSMSRETLIAVARELRVDLVLMGTLHDYDMQTGTGTGGGSQIPVLAVTLRVVDARFGDIVWAANAARRGTDHETVFGVGRVYSLNTLAEQTAADMGEAFADSMRHVRPRKSGRKSVAEANDSRTDAAPTDVAPAKATPAPAASANAGPTEAAAATAAPANVSPANFGRTDAASTNAAPANAGSAHAAPAAAAPSTAAPAAAAPATVAPATVAPANVETTAAASTNAAPANVGPTTAAPTDAAPMDAAPAIAAPADVASTNGAPTNIAAAEPAPANAEPEHAQSSNE